MADYRYPTPPVLSGGGSTNEGIRYHPALYQQQQQQHQLVRHQPTDAEPAMEEDPKPSFPIERLQRRESRIGLRNLFTRSSRNLKEQREKDQREEEQKQQQQQHRHHHPQAQHHHHPQQQRQQHPLAAELSATTPEPEPSPQLQPASHSETGSRSGLLATLADIGNWPHSLGHPLLRSEGTTPTPSTPDSDLRPNAIPAMLRRQRSGTLTSLRPQRASTTSAPSWEPPPLFLAYSQSIKYTHLRASTISGDSILRLCEKSERKGNTSLRQDLNQQLSVAGPATDVPEPQQNPHQQQQHQQQPQPHQQPQRSDREKGKKKQHQKHTHSSSIGKLEWTTKIYVLSAHGHLLQYAGAGPFDRLPEKILTLTKDSAAFASDVIPGFHWVLQVASHMEPDGAVTDSSATPHSITPPRSLLSRLQLRSADRRHAANFLMIFEDAEDMEGWMLALRGEIRARPDKDVTTTTATEAGAAKAARLEHPHHGRSVSYAAARPSKANHRPSAAPARDHDRYGGTATATRNMPWPAQSPHQHQQHQHQHQDGSGAAASETGGYKRSYDSSRSAPDSGRSGPPPPLEPATDAMSATNSFVSQDARQLDSLREGSSGNRLSFISSGQRTMITSPGSSPACSPTQEAFSPSYLLPDEPRTPARDIIMPPPVLLPRFLAEVRSRPNAADILDRSQSDHCGHPVLVPDGGRLCCCDREACLPQQPQAPPPPSTPSQESATNLASAQNQSTSTTTPTTSTTPNFSVPHSVGRRYSLARGSPPIESASALASFSARGGGGGGGADGRPRVSKRCPPPPPLSLSSRSRSAAAPQQQSQAVRKRPSVRSPRLPPPPPPPQKTVAAQSTGHQSYFSLSHPDLPAAESRPFGADAGAGAGAGAGPGAGPGAAGTSPRKYASMYTLRNPSTTTSSSAPGPLALLPAFDASPSSSDRDLSRPVAQIPPSPPLSPMEVPPQNLGQLPPLPLPSPQFLQYPHGEVRRARSSIGSLHRRNNSRGRSPSVSSVGRSPSRSAGRGGSGGSGGGGGGGGGGSGGSGGSGGGGGTQSRQRASLQIGSADGTALPHSLSIGGEELKMGKMPPSHVASMMVSNARAASANMHSQLDLAALRQGLINRRSLPQLVAEGPPPAPPPTCALPPIPQKLAVKG